MSSFTETLMHGNERAFKPATLTPLQKLTLQYVIFGLVYYGFAAIEGMLMRINQVQPQELLYPERYFAMLTAHPLVGIFGSSYLLVFGAFTFLVPYLMKKPLWSLKTAQWSLWLIVVGVFIQTSTLVIPSDMKNIGALVMSLSLRNAVPAQGLDRFWDEAARNAVQRWAERTYAGLYRAVLGELLVGILLGPPVLGLLLAGLALVLGLMHPTLRPERTRASILKYFGGLVGIGLALAWVMYLLPGNPVRF